MITTEFQTEDLFSIMLEEARKKFYCRPEYPLIKEKRSEIDLECECMLKESEQEFVQECFETLSEIEQKEQTFLYRQAMIDCVQLLKALKVLE